MTTITKERLIKIQQWRETYGARNNVILPAEEAAELARIALASLDAVPVAHKNALAVPPVCRRAPAWTGANCVDPRQCYIAGWNACRAAMLNSPSASKGE